MNSLITYYDVCVAEYSQVPIANGTPSNTPCTPSTVLDTGVFEGQLLKVLNPQQSRPYTHTGATYSPRTTRTVVTSTHTPPTHIDRSCYQYDMLPSVSEYGARYAPVLLSNPGYSLYSLQRQLQQLHEFLYECEQFESYNRMKLEEVRGSTEVQQPTYTSAVLKSHDTGNAQSSATTIPLPSTAISEVGGSDGTTSSITSGKDKHATKSTVNVNADGMWIPYVKESIYLMQFKLDSMLQDLANGKVDKVPASRCTSNTHHANTTNSTVPRTNEYVTYVYQNSNGLYQVLSTQCYKLLQLQLNYLFQQYSTQVSTNSTTSKVSVSKVSAGGVCMNMNVDMDVDVDIPAVSGSASNGHSAGGVGSNDHSAGLYAQSGDGILVLPVLVRGTIEECTTVVVTAHLQKQYPALYSAFPLHASIQEVFINLDAYFGIRGKSADGAAGKRNKHKYKTKHKGMYEAMCVYVLYVVIDTHTHT